MDNDLRKALEGIVEGLARACENDPVLRHDIETAIFGFYENMAAGSAADAEAEALDELDVDDDDDIDDEDLDDDELESAGSDGERNRAFDPVRMSLSCKLKAVVAKWAGVRSGLSPQDVATIEGEFRDQASKLGTGGLWLLQTGRSLPADPVAFVSLSQAYEALAEAGWLYSRVFELETRDATGEEQRDALGMFLAAVVALGRAIGPFGPARDEDLVAASQLMQTVFGQTLAEQRRRCELQVADAAGIAELLDGIRVYAASLPGRLATHRLLARLQADGETSAMEAPAAVREAVALVRGQSAILVVGRQERTRARALEAALELAELTTIVLAPDQDARLYAAEFARTDVAVVLLAPGVARQAEVRALCGELGKPVVELLNGLDPPGAASQIRRQIGGGRRREGAA